MFACPICGSANPPGQPSCSICGTVFVPPEPPPGNVPAALQQTLVGHMAPAGLRSAAPPMKQTLVGFGPEQTAPAPTPAAAPAPEPRPLARTVLGLGAPAALLEAGAPPPPAEPRPTEPKRTAVGLGPEEPPPQPRLPEPAPAGLPPAKRTILGVARPGIAPLNPGVEKPAPVIIADVPPPPYLTPALEPATGREGPTLPLLPDLNQPLTLTPPPARSGKLLAILLALLGLAGLAVAGWALLRSGPELGATLDMDDRGTELLKLECADCSDGTTASLDGKSARFVAHKATLPLSRVLVIGDNQLSLTLTPPSGQPSTVELDVPLQYRVRGDLKALADPEPKIRIWIEAEPGTKALVDGASVALGPDGKGQHLIDVRAELTGSATGVSRVEKKLVYTLSPPGRSQVRGDLQIQIGVVPLVVDAPGADVITDRPEFMLSGRSHRGAAVSVAGRPVATDTAGGFAQLMSVSTTGETTIVVRADAPSMAPRLFPIRVKRVADLQAEAQRLKSGALDSYAALERADPAGGARVALEGRLAEARIDNHRAILLLETAQGCNREPCLVRVLYGLAPAARKGQTARVFGRLVGRVPGLSAGSTIPEVRADIVVLGT